MYSLGDGLQRPLDAVEDLLHEARPQLHAERLAGPVDGVADRQPGRVLIALRSAEGASPSDPVSWSPDALLMNDTRPLTLLRTTPVRLCRNR